MAQTSPMPEPEPRYAALREQVEGILTEGRMQSRQAGQWEKVGTYWHVGDALLSHIGSQPRAGYGEQVIASLSADTGLTPSMLWDLLRFRRAIPALVAYRQLGWSHIRAVLSLPNQEQRRYYLQRANAEGWSVRQLQDALVADAYALQATQPYAVPPDEDPCAGRPLRPRFGQLWTYRVLASGEPGSTGLVLDVGFAMCAATDLSGIADPRPGAIVTSTRVAGSHFTFTRRPANTRRYTYVAWSRRIIDGDTLIADVDLGFGCQARGLRLRLRGIDCRELNTLAGRRARQFVTEALSQVTFVVVSTHRTDNYGRYLADVRYLVGETDPEVVRSRGTYLNRQLLLQRLARRYQG